MTPSLFLHLANLHRPRRQGHEAGDGDRLAIASLCGASAHSGSDAEADLDKLSQVASELADAIVAGRVPLPVGNLNTLARAAPSFQHLITKPTRSAVKLERSELPAEPTAVLAARVAAELGLADLTRIKECARSECSLVFYDDTRSRTQRWHAEAPCGRLERQRRHRTLLDSLDDNEALASVLRVLRQNRERIVDVMGTVTALMRSPADPYHERLVACYPQIPAASCPC